MNESLDNIETYTNNISTISEEMDQSLNSIEDYTRDVSTISATINESIANVENYTNNISTLAEEMEKSLDNIEDYTGNISSVTVDSRYNGKESTSTFGVAYTDGSASPGANFYVTSYSFWVLGTTGTLSTNIGGGVLPVEAGEAINNLVIVPKANVTLNWTLAQGTTAKYMIYGVE